MEQDHFHIWVKVDPSHIDIFNKIVEAYDNLAIVTAVDPGQGELVVRGTKDTKKDTLRLLKHMPFFVEIDEKDAE